MAGLAIGIGFVILFSILSFYSTPREGSQTQPKGEEKIVFSGLLFNETKHQIYIINSNGSNIINLTQDDKNAWHFAPVPSPDGSKIAYARAEYWPTTPRDGIFSSEIYVMNANGTDKSMIVGGDSASSKYGTMTNSTKIPIGTYQLGRLSWSPDSAKLAYEAYGGIYVTRLDAPMGTKPQRITYDDPDDVSNTHPVWLTDNSIAFERIVFNGTNRVTSDAYYKINVDGTDRKQMFEVDSDHDTDFVWSNDRTRVAFIHFDSNAANIYVMPIANNVESAGNRSALSQAKLLFSGKSIDSISELSWSRDDRRIAFLGGLQWNILNGGNGLETEPRFRFFTIDPHYYNGLARALALPSGKTFGLNSEVWSSGAYWSLQGRIAYMANIGEAQSAATIYVISVNGSINREIVSMQNTILGQEPLDWISTK